MADHKKSVFLSYAASNRELADLVVPVVQAAGFDVLTIYGVENVKQAQADALRELISQCDLALILVTPSAIDSQWLPFEIGMVRAFDLPAILLYEGLTRNELPEYLGGFQTAGVSQVADVVKQAVAKLKLAEA